MSHEKLPIDGNSQPEFIWGSLEADTFFKQLMGIEFQSGLMQAWHKDADLYLTRERNDLEYFRGLGLEEGEPRIMETLEDIEEMEIAKSAETPFIALMTCPVVDDSNKVIGGIWGLGKVNTKNGKIIGWGPRLYTVFVGEEIVENDSQLTPEQLETFKQIIELQKTVGLPEDIIYY